MKISLVITCLLILFCQLADGRRRRPGGRRNQNRRRNQDNAPTSQAPTQSDNRCEDITLPMCRGLVPYSKTLLPNEFGHTTQRQVYRALEYLWPFMDIGCSQNFRVMACGLYLPKCPNGGQRFGFKPCRETCKKARRCRRRLTELQSSWPREFKCPKLKPKSSGKCIPPVPERASCSHRHVSCERNEHEFCQGLNFPKGSIPNMFLQCSKPDIHKELNEYRLLLDSGCSENLAFLLCGIFQPFCDRPENPFALPCQEICELVRSECEAAYTRLYGGLWWPTKLQCHRYPRSTDSNRVCVMPGDSVIPLPEVDNRE